MAEPIDIVFVQIYKVGGSAALLELRTRLLADRHDATEALSKAHSVADTEAAVVDYFKTKNLLTDDDARLLATARKVRNKFLHGDFRKAIELLEDYRGKKFESKVGMIRIPKSGQKIADVLRDNIDGKKMPIPVVETTGKDDKLYGWMLQASASGALKEAEELLIKAIAIVQGIAEHPDSLK